jgi:membrane protease YdiL (CAAX protease family)
LPSDPNYLNYQPLRPIPGLSIVLFLAALAVLFVAASVGFWLFPVVWPPLVLIANLYGLILLAALIALWPLGRQAPLALAIRGARWKPLVFGPVATLALSIGVSQLGPDVESMKQVAELVRSFKSTMASIVVLGVLAPVVEEVVFRGLLYGWIDGRWGWRPAVVVSALAFALAHYQWQAEGWERLAYALAVLPLGLLFSWLRWRTSSLLPSVVSHIVNNSFAVASAAWLGSS